MSETLPAITVPSRFCGPPGSGNGGYTAGLLAERVPGQDREDCPAVEVTLRKPPPLDRPMAVRAEDPDVVLLDGDPDEVVAAAHCVPADLEPVDSVAPAEAEAAAASYPGLRSHPFPTCFACGPDRAEGDGLRIFPGPVSGDRFAALWVPHAAEAESSDLLDEGVPRVGVPIAWAALDCISGWAGHMEERTMVLGRMTARVDALPVVGEPHVVVGRRVSEEGRKTFTASTLYDSDDRVVARAAHVWIALTS